VNFNLNTTEIISLALWVVALVAVVLWGQSCRKRKRDIVGSRKIFYAISAVVLVVALGGLVFRGLQFGLDFTGGTIIEIGAPQKVTVANTAIADLVKASMPHLKDVQVQMAETMEVGADGKSYQKILIRFKDESEEGQAAPQTEAATPPAGQVEPQAQNAPTGQAAQILQTLEPQLNAGKLFELSATSIGATVTGELKRGAVLALLVALILQLLYITLRFGNQLRFGLAADVALAHDVVIMTGLYALAGLPVDSPWVAALMTVAGYSVMDSVVIFDRIREHLKSHKGTFAEIVNDSVNETMTRSVNTTLTTVIVCVALYFFGGVTLKSFAFALLVGIISGAYSSIFVAGPVLVEIDAYTRKREAARAQERRLAAEERTREGRPAALAMRDDQDYPSPDELPETSGRVPGEHSRPRRRVKGTRRKA